MLPVISRLPATPVSGGGRPNVLVITADDLQGGRIGCEGEREAITPNLDRLARRGTVFRHAQCTMPVCNPSRLSVLAGQHARTLGVFGNTKREARYPEVTFMPEYFRRNGYFSGVAGKVFHGGPERLIGHGPQFDWRSDARGLSQDELMRHRIRGLGGGAPGRPTLTERRKMPNTAVRIFDVDDDAFDDYHWAHDIARQLERRANGGQPFFLWAGLFLPHVPYHTSRRYWEMHDPASKAPPDDPATNLDDIPPAALHFDPASERPDSPETRRTCIAGHDACVTMLDAQIGILLDQMDRLGLWDNTVVLFFGDQGAHLGEHGGLYAKNTLFEEATHSPFIMAAPGMGGGQYCRRVSSFADAFPTLVDLCGLPPPGQTFDGASLRPLMQNAGEPWNRPAFTIARTYNGGNGESVRTERWRYNEWNGGNAGHELYDMANDPRQFRNVVNEPEYADVRRELAARLNEWRGNGGSPGHGS